jgi:hypothetical protein
MSRKLEFHELQISFGPRKVKKRDLDLEKNLMLNDG